MRPSDALERRFTANSQRVFRFVAAEGGHALRSRFSGRSPWVERTRHIFDYHVFIAFQYWSASNYLILISLFQCGTTIWNILKALAISIFDGWAPTPLPLPRTIEIRDSRTTSVSNQFLNTTPSFRANSFRKEKLWKKTGHGTELCVMVLRIRPRTDLYGWVEDSVSESTWLIVRCSFSEFEIYSGAQMVFFGEPSTWVDFLTCYQLTYF